MIVRKGLKFKNAWTQFKKDNGENALDILLGYQVPKDFWNRAEDYRMWVVYKTIGSFLKYHSDEITSEQKEKLIGLKGKLWKVKFDPETIDLWA